MDLIFRGVAIFGTMRHVKQQGMKSLHEGKYKENEDNLTEFISRGTIKLTPLAKAPNVELDQRNFDYIKQ